MVNRQAEHNACIQRCSTVIDLKVSDVAWMPGRHMKAVQKLSETVC